MEQHQDHVRRQGGLPRSTRPEASVDVVGCAAANVAGTAHYGPSNPTLPSNHAFVVQFRTRPSGAPSWEGRVEHLVSYQVARFHSLDELLAFMLRVLTEVEAQ